MLKVLGKEVHEESQMRKYKSKSFHFVALGCSCSLCNLMDEHQSYTDQFPWAYKFTYLHTTCNDMKIIKLLNYHRAYYLLMNLRRESEDFYFH